MFVDKDTRERFQLALSCIGTPALIADYLEYLASQLRSGTPDNELGTEGLASGYIHYDYQLDLCPESTDASLKSLWDRWNSEEINEQV